MNARLSRWLATELADLSGIPVGLNRASMHGFQDREFDPSERLADFHSESLGAACGSRLVEGHESAFRFGCDRFSVANDAPPFETAPWRRQLACEAALAVGAAVGVVADRAVVMQDWNNTIVRLGDTPIVAKVGTSHFRDAALESLERELAVSVHLAACAAPVVRPTVDVPAGPHEWRGLTVTLWEYVEPVRGELEPAVVASALRLVHEALKGFPGRLPVFAVDLGNAERLLRPDRSPDLDAADRGFLLSVVGELRAALAGLQATYRPLHGSPHGANWLLGADGPLLLDFETACVGPLEWDLSALGDDVVAFFPGVDRGLLGTLRRMRSVCVAAKCWVAPDRALELREAAEVHLKLLRGERLD